MAQMVSQRPFPHIPLVPEVRDDFEVGDDPNEDDDAIQTRKTTVPECHGERARMSAVWYTPWADGFERVRSSRYVSVLIGNKPAHFLPSTLEPLQ